MKQKSQKPFAAQAEFLAADFLRDWKTYQFVMNDYTTREIAAWLATSPATVSRVNNGQEPPTLFILGACWLMGKNPLDYYKTSIAQQIAMDFVTNE